MKQFVAMTDDVLYRRDDLPGPLVPYQCGVFCWHRLREELLASSAPPAPTILKNADDGVALSA
jgi:hypothetical protein